MTTDGENCCPGCGLRMPPSAHGAYEGYYNTSPECWSVYTEVLGAECSNGALFGQVHQLTVDAYAVQHAGGPHPDKSVDIHLAGLHLVLEKEQRPPDVPRLLQRIALSAKTWPHFAVPEKTYSLTVFDVALSDTAEQHAKAVRLWAGEAWSACHAKVARFVELHLATER